MEALKSVPTIIGAAIYDAQGKVFARYSHDANVLIPEKISWYGYHSGFYHIDFADTIVLDGEIIGSIYICAELESFYSRMARYGFTLIIIMGLAFILSYVLFTKLHQIITKPIFALTDLMHVVSKEQDYSVRAHIHEKDELGYLGQGFNEMLEKIHERDTELAHYRAHLEELVEKRTSELTITNQELEKELAERFRVEKELLESEYRYRTIFETTGNPSLIIGADTTILMVNSAFERISGYGREEVEGKMSSMSLVAVDDLERLKEYHDTRRIDPTGGPGRIRMSRDR